MSPQPLSTVNNWTASIAIPSSLFMGQSVGDYVKQTYALLSNGTFVASDDSGNTLGWKMPSGLPQGTLSTRLVANSSTAIQTFTVLSTQAQMLANVTVSYSIRQQFCQPAGLEVAISGQVNWGPSGSGTISLPFQNSPIQVNGSTAWFGNRSGVWLGFDWSDSSALNPVFSSSTNSVSWEVGSSNFVIDPVVVAQVNTPMFGRWDHLIWRAQGLWWFFYPHYDLGTNSYWINYRTSNNGTSWSAAGKASPNEGVNFAFDIAVSGNKIWYVSNAGGNHVYFTFRYGVLLSNGSISWNISESSNSITYVSTTVAPSLTFDSYGNPWVVLVEKSSTGASCACDIEVFKVSGGGFTSQFTASFTTNKTAQIVALSGGKMSLVACSSCGISGYSGAISIRTYSGTAWNAWLSGPAPSQMGYFSAAAFNVTTYVEYEDYTAGAMGIRAFNYTYGASNMSSPTLVKYVSSSQALNTAVSTDSSGGLYVMIGNITGNWISVSKSGDGSNTWFSFALPTANATYQRYNSLTAVYTTSNLTAIGWSAGSSSPYNLEFSSFPLIVPDAATSGNPSSKPGISPYETYFTNLNEYVSPGNGLLGIKQVDFSIPGRNGLDVVLARNFITPYAFMGNMTVDYDNYTHARFGLGWQLNLPWLGANFLHLADGQVYPYHWSGNKFENHAGANFVLTKNSNSSYTLYLADGTLYYFNPSKQLLSITDRTGNNTISFSYSSFKLSTITDTLGRTYNFTYNANSYVRSISTGEGTWTYNYSGSELTSVTDPLGRTTTYQYNTGSSTKNNPWLISAVIYPTGAKTTYTYGSAPVGVDAVTYYVTSQNIYSSPSALSKSSSFNYSISDGKVKLCNVTVSDGSIMRGYTDYNFTNSTASLRTEKDGSGNAIRSYEQDFDSLGRIDEQKMLSPTNTLLAYSLTKYDNWSNVIYTRDNIGHEEWFSYANTNSSNTFLTTNFTNSFYTNSISSNIHDLLVGQVQYQNGTGTTREEEYFQYNQAGEPTQQKHLLNGNWIYSGYTYDNVGNKLTWVDANGHTTYYQYSSQYLYAYLTKDTAHIGTQAISTSYTYNFTNGLVLSSTDPKNQTTYFSYDNLGRLLSVAYPPVKGVVAVKTYSYNDSANIITSTDENGNVIKQYFDGLGRMVKQAAYNGTALYTTTNYTYNWINQISSKTMPTGKTYSYNYDALGNQIKQTNPDSTYITTSFDYVNNTKTVTDENSHKVQYGYDWNNNLIWDRQYYNSTNYYQTTYAYDKLGDLGSTTDAKGQVTTYKYDNFNRLTLTKYPDGTNETRSYDNMSNLVSKVDPMRQNITYSYDALNRLTQITYPDKSAVTYIYDNDSNKIKESNPSATLNYAYDARNRLVNETETVGGTSYTLLYSYDKASNIISVVYPDNYNLTYSYDALNRISRVGTLANLTYTKDSRINTIVYANGVNTTYSYDSRDRPTRILTRYGSSTLLDLNYTYDGTGNVLTINTEKYSYDWLNRLNSGNGSWGNVVYSYDAAGNMAKKVNGSTTTNYSYDSYNRMLSAGGINFTYNNDGDLTKKVDGLTTMNYHYDYENRLTSVVKNGVTQQNNTYDGEGQRVEMFAGSYTLFFLYPSPVNMLYEQNLTSTVENDRIYANGMAVAELIGGSTLYYYHLDALGSVRLTTGAGGTSVFSTNYSPFGGKSGASGFEYLQYTSKPYDVSTGLYYFGARFYAPGLGRFITEDTNTGKKEDPLSLNRYIYTDDNPEKYIDPNGHMMTGEIIDGYYVNPTTADTNPVVTGETYDSTTDSSVTPPAPTPSPTTTTTTASSPSNGSDEYCDWNGCVASSALNSEPSNSVGAEYTYSSQVTASGNTGSTTQDFGCVGTTVPPYSACGTPDEGGAQLFTAGVLVAAGVILLASSAVDGPVGIIIGGGLLVEGIDAAAYDAEKGPSATWEGAAIASIQDTIQLGSDLFTALTQ